jgi:hypothetical protein
MQDRRWNGKQVGLKSVKAESLQRKSKIIRGRRGGDLEDKSKYVNRPFPFSIIS